ncbi:MAG: tetratricopeptide repeat protein [Ktedonobacteraceae bacterium]|nr:tetratricopeptide repeat protein [Ktedonobacteraceae bacterium]
MLSPKILSRESLLARLQEIISRPEEDLPHYRLLLLQAPAGYGKTTLLADFARHATTPCCWYFLEASDTKATTFLTNMLLSIRVRFPMFGLTIDLLLEGDDGIHREVEVGPDIEAMAAVLIAAIEREISAPFALFLCNYQEVEISPAVTTLVNCLLRELPVKCMLVIESRVAPDLDIAPLLAQRAMIAIDSSLLRFTAQEVRDLAVLQGIEPLSEQQAEQLVHTFDGWIMGMLLGTRLGNRYMTQKVVSDRRPPGYLEHTELLVSKQHLFSYIVNDVFKRHPEAYAFLREAVVLQEMTPQLCTALLEIAEMADTAERLQSLEQNGLFVRYREEGARIIYICHPLIRSMLLEDLHSRAPERFALLHQRAAELLSMREDHKSAIAHAFEAGDDDLSARLIIHGSEPLLTQGYMEILAHWIDALPVSVTTHYPRLSLIRANILLMQGNHANALALLDQIAPVLACPSLDLDPDDRAMLQAECSILKSKALFQRGEYPQARVLCQQVLERLPADEVTMRSEVYTRLGVCLNLQGEYAEGIAHLQKALQLWGRHTIARQTAEIHSTLASTYSLLGNFALAEHHISRAIACWEQMHDNWGRINNIIRLGLIKQRQAAFIEAEEAFTQALALARGDQHFQRGQAYALVSLGELFQDQGFYERSLAFTEDGLALARQIKDKYLVNCALCILAMTYLYMGDAATALILVSEVAIQNDQRAVPGYEQAIYDLTYGTILLHLRRYDEVYACLSKMETSVHTMGLKREQICATLRIAACLLEQGQIAEWVHRMEELAAMLETLNGYRHLVLMELRRLPKLQKAIQGMPALTSLQARSGPRSERQEPAIPASPTLSLFPELASLAGSAETPQIKEHSPIQDISGVTASQPPKIDIRAFGEPVVLLQDEPVTRWRMARSMELFFFLLDGGRPMRKEQIITALWSEVDEQINQTFHSTIYYLRKALGIPCLISRGGSYTLNLAAHFGGRVWYDVTAFQQHYVLAKQAVAQGDDSMAKEAFLAMIELYTGDYVQPFYSDWCILRRDELQRAYLDARGQLAHIAWRNEQFDESARHWQHMLALDNCIEQAHYGLMRSYLRQGKRGLALRQYQRCRSILQSELGIQPGSTIQTLYQRLTGEHEATS